MWRDVDGCGVLLRTASGAILTLQGSAICGTSKAGYLFTVTSVFYATMLAS